MPMTINTNIISLNAQRNLNGSQSSLATSMQRLSSGLRVNSANGAIVVDLARGTTVAKSANGSVRLGDVVVILGTGPIGCWQAVMCRDRGASRIYMTDVQQDRLDLAMSIVGSFVDEAFVAGEDNGVGEVLAKTGGAGADRVSVAAPSKQAQQAALEMAAKRAKVVYFAGLPKHDPVSPLDMNELHYKELVISGAYGATHRQYRITMDYLARRQDELARVVTHRFPLEQIGEAFDTIRSGTGLKMVIVP